jgi:hypothetical protein
VIVLIKNVFRASLNAVRTTSREMKSFIVVLPLHLVLYTLPLLLASQIIRPNFLTITTAFLAYVWIWTRAAIPLLRAAALLNGYPAPLNALLSIDHEEPGILGPVNTTILLGLSFGRAIYGFALAYVFLSRTNLGSFATSHLGIISGVRCSLAAISGASYSAIVPLSSAARFLVGSEIVAGTTYSILGLWAVGTLILKCAESMPDPASFAAFLVSPIFAKSPILFFALLIVTPAWFAIGSFRVTVPWKVAGVFLTVLWLEYWKQARISGELAGHEKLLLSLFKWIRRKTISVLCVSAVVVPFGYGISGLGGVYDGLDGVAIGAILGEMSFGNPTLCSFIFGLVLSVFRNWSGNPIDVALARGLGIGFASFAYGVAVSTRRALMCGGLIARGYAALFRNPWVLRPTIRKDRRLLTRSTLFIIILAAVPLSQFGSRVFQLSTAIRGCVIAAISALVGMAVGRHLRTRLAHLRIILRILRTLSSVLGIFSFGYITIVVMFASFFMAEWRINPGAFKGTAFPATPRYTDFLYFSAVTAATVGYGDIIPTSNASRLLAALEVIAAIGWTAILLGAVAGFLQPTFAILRSKRQRHSINKSSGRAKLP